LRIEDFYPPRDLTFPPVAACSGTRWFGFLLVFFSCDAAEPFSPRISLVSHRAPRYLPIQTSSPPLGQSISVWKVVSLVVVTVQNPPTFFISLIPPFNVDLSPQRIRILCGHCSIFDRVIFTPPTGVSAFPIRTAAARRSAILSNSLRRPFSFFFTGFFFSLRLLQTSILSTGQHIPRLCE